ncbi:replication protein A 30 kDa subunit-like [Choloepus didactylus]|uniref:replication protein A 30 kDa subunit-like n=1 Tax=Choloepus didactylus TaxID=27675 RepID=UPI0018A077A4|nr:replication protein A 30 kDa subunit-like [Choloepus didactylus]
MTSKPIEVWQWVCRDKAKHGLTLIPVGVCAKVFGILKFSSRRKSLEVLKIQVLEDMNKFTTHILEMVDAHMILDKAHHAAIRESVPVSPLGMDDARDYGEYRLSFIQKEVLRLIHKCPRPEGKSLRELQNELRSLSGPSSKQLIT